VAHTGKIYSVLSHRLARLIHARCPKSPRYTCISPPASAPPSISVDGVQLILPDGMELADIEAMVREMVAAELARMRDFQTELIRGSTLSARTMSLESGARWVRAGKQERRGSDGSPVRQLCDELGPAKVVLIREPTVGLEGLW